MRIVGFGTCMINGFGVGEEFSFFYQSLNLLKKKMKNVEFGGVISLGGFPITRAAKYLDKKVVRLQPDIVVLQFANIDINIAVEKKLKKIYGKIKEKKALESESNKQLDVIEK